MTEKRLKLKSVEQPIPEDDDDDPRFGTEVLRVCVSREGYCVLVDTAFSDLLKGENGSEHCSELTEAFNTTLDVIQKVQ